VKKEKMANLTLFNDTVTEGGQGEDIDVSSYKEAKFFLNISDLSGTKPIFRCWIVTRDSISGNYAFLGSFDQFTNQGIQSLSIPNCLGHYIAVSYTLSDASDASPSCTFSVSAVAK
jgi:hypothetical protein